MEEKIAVLIPCLNEEKTIKKVIEDFITVLDGKNYTIYIYDNDSNDNTKQVVKSIKSDNLVYKFEPIRGKGRVVKRMFREIEADVYLLVDGDDTYPAEYALEMCDFVIKDAYDMVTGDRLSSTYHQENKRPFHSFGNNLVCKLINILFKSNLKDIMSGYRAFSRKFVKNSALCSKGFEIETEISILALDNEFLVKEIPIAYRDRIEGSQSKLNTYSDGFKILKTIFILFKDYKPFEFFSFFACLFAIISLVLFLPILLEYLKIHLVPRFPTLFISVFFAILSILSFNLGVILSVVVKMFKRTKELIFLNNLHDIKK